MPLKDRLAAAMAGPPKVTQSALARAAKVSQPSVNDWLSGKSKTMRGGTLLAVARVLNVDPDWLANGRGQMRRNPLASGPLADVVSIPRDDLTPEVVAEAEYWVRFEEGSGVKFHPVRRAERLLELCREVVKSGGRLPPEQAAQIIKAREIAQQGKQRGGAESDGRGVESR